MAKFGDGVLHGSLWSNLYTVSSLIKDIHHCNLKNKKSIQLHITYDLQSQLQLSRMCMPSSEPQVRKKMLEGANRWW